MSGECKAARFSIDSERGNVVGALIAGIKKTSRRIDVKTPRIVAAGPFLRHEGERSILTHRKDRDSIVKTIAHVHEPSVGGDHDLGSKTAPGKSRRKAGDGLPCRQSSFRGVVVK